MTTIQTELLLSHWYRPQTVLRLDASFADGRKPDLKLADAPTDDAPDEMAEYDCIMATQDPWMLRLWSYDPDAGRYAARWTSLRLTITPKTVFAQLATPAGIPAMWNHFTWGSPSLGRVSEMKASNGSLTGRIALSSAALAVYGTSLDQIDAGMNRGLSAGLRLIDEPELKMAKGDAGGTFDKPDKLTYGRARVAEMSLTATPMIVQAGITSRRQMEG